MIFLNTEVVVKLRVRITEVMVAVLVVANMMGVGGMKRSCAVIEFQAKYFCGSSRDPYERCSTLV